MALRRIVGADTSALIGLARSDTALVRRGHHLGEALIQRTLREAGEG